MANRCLMCGRIIEEVEWRHKDAYEEEDEEELPKKAPSFCPRCQAKIKKESDDKQKPQKPM